MLKKCFANQPLSYKIFTKVVAVSAKDREPFLSAMVVQPLSVITPVKGTVLGSDGQPLPGASVFVKNTKSSGVSNADGMFTLNVNKGDTLVISYIAYQSREMVITSSMISSCTLSVTLVKTNAEFDR